MNESVAHTGDMSIGAVLTATGRQFVKNFFPLLLLSLLVFSPLIAFDLFFREFPNIGDINEGYVSTVLAATAGVENILYSLMATIQALIIAPFIVGRMRGREVSLADAASVGMRKLGSAIGVMIMVGIATTIGFLLLIIPGIILTLMFALIIPVLVLEDTDAFVSMERSATLTKGSRWRVLLGYVLVFIFTIAVLSLAELVPWQESWRLENMFLCVASAAEAVFIAVLYEHLLIAREGGDAEAIISTFE